MALHGKRVASKQNTGINSLITAANLGDRFRLLEDDVPLPELDNDIHPIFDWFDSSGPMNRMLRLASQFLQYDSTLIFFIPLLYGKEVTSVVNGQTKNHLSNPLSTATLAESHEMLQGVRSALQCLSHSIEFEFASPNKRVYARTLMSTRKPTHTSRCFHGFKGDIYTKIEISDRFSAYYDAKNGYSTATLCAQLRHDFLFATTLIHELVHAIGIMQRGSLLEPYIREDYPESEWGYAWEHFMFGGIFNPQDRKRPGTHLLMRKVWVDTDAAKDAGGKEYCDVSMAYIAKWFRKATWDVVAKRGPIAVPPPTTHFKIQSSNKFGGWIVSTDCEAIRPELIRTYEMWQELSRVAFDEGSARTISRILWRLQSTKSLQRPNVKPPSRIIVDWLRCLTCGRFWQEGCEDTCKKEEKGMQVQKRKRSSVDKDYTITKKLKRYFTA